MSASYTIRYALGTSFLTCLALVITGCGSDDGLGNRYSVYGTVTYNSQPLEKGTINFAPEDATGRAASGLIENGYYTLTTQEPGDGALPGKYKVIITSKDIDMSKAEQLFKAKLKGQHETSIVPKDFMTKAAKSAKSRIPERYGRPDTSKLSAEVKEQSNSIPFDLTD
jgi:hypothetical protein